MKRPTYVLMCMLGGCRRDPHWKRRYKNIKGIENNIMPVAPLSNKIMNLKVLKIIYYKLKIIILQFKIIFEKCMQL